MRSALFWIVGASLAFFLTAGAFLVLANFGTAPKASDPIPSPGPTEGGPRGPKLTLSFSDERLEALERRREQTLTLYLKNGSEEELESVDLELAVSSEDTKHPEVRRYHETVERLAPGEVEAVDMTVDLSPIRPVEGMVVLGEGPGRHREVLEARADAPGATAVKTAVVSP